MDIKEQYKILEFDDYGDERGNLVVAECSGVDVPFQVERVFYMYGSDDQVIRGQHANRRTEFVLINVGGTSKVRIDNGFQYFILFLYIHENLLVLLCQENLLHASITSSTSFVCIPENIGKDNTSFPYSSVTGKSPSPNPKYSYASAK